jgi:hypothetical protein
MRAARRLLALVLIGCFLAGVGCAGGGAVSGVSYSVCAIAKSKDGKVSPQGPATQVEAAGVGDREEVTHESTTLAVQVRKTQYAKATFEITFPDHSLHMVQVKAGETKDILPKGQKVGVRIEVQESH